jgi:hypothetical protein
VHARSKKSTRHRSLCPAQGPDLLESDKAVPILPDVLGRRWFGCIGDTVRTLAFAYDRSNRPGDCFAGREKLVAIDNPVRPATAETAHLSTRAAADRLNRRGITTANGKRWHAMQVLRARHRLGLMTGVRLVKDLNITIE